MVNIFSKWKDKVADYIDIKMKLMKLTLVEHISGVMSYLVYVLVLLFMFFAVFVFVGIGLGEWMAELVDSRSGGYFITAGIYVLFIFLLIALRKSLIKSFSGLFIGVLTAVKDDEDDDEQDNGLLNDH